MLRAVLASNSRQKKQKKPPNGAKVYSPGEGSPGRGDAPLGKKVIAGIAGYLLPLFLFNAQFVILF